MKQSILGSKEDNKEIYNKRCELHLEELRFLADSSKEIYVLFIIVYQSFDIVRRHSAINSVCFCFFAIERNNFLFRI